MDFGQTSTEASDSGQADGTESNSTVEDTNIKSERHEKAISSVEQGDNQSTTSATTTTTTTTTATTTVEPEADIDPLILAR